ncbi:MAG: hypothetical protein ABIG61_08655 [Planctomycetota bacterium]
MSMSEKIKTFLLIVVIFSLLPALSMRADDQFDDEWAEVPTLVNYVDYNDMNSVPQGVKDKVAGALKRANEILGKKNVELDHTDSHAVSVGNNDGVVDANERSSLRGSGPNELDKLYGECNGVKVDVVNDIDEGNPAKTWNGVSVRGSKVVIIDITRVDVNAIGRTIAHEMLHDIGLLGDTYEANDINSLRYGRSNGGTTIEPNDANALHNGARGRGRTAVAFSIAPGAGLGLRSSMLVGVADARGAKHDGLKDPFCPNPMYNPDDPAFRYADVHMVKMFCPNPGTPGSLTTLRLHLAGPFSIDSFFDVFYEIWITNDHDPYPDIKITYGVHGIGGGELLTDAFYENFDTGVSYPLDPPLAENLHELVDGEIGPATNAAVSHEIHTEIIAMDLTGSAPIQVSITSIANDSRIPGDSIIDEVEPFNFGLSLRPADPVVFLIEPGEGAMGLGYGIAGSGFQGIPEVVIEIDNQQVGSASVKGDGSFTHFLDPTVELTGLHRVFVHPPRGMNMVPEGRGVWGTATLNFGCVLEGDINGDNIVNMLDLAKLANDWMVQCP